MTVFLYKSDPHKILGILLVAQIVSRNTISNGSDKTVWISYLVPFFAFYLFTKIYNKDLNLKF